jgi:hypothetical protein
LAFKILKNINLEVAICTVKKPLFFLVIFIWLVFTGHVAAGDDGELPDLWLDLSMGAPLIDLFNERARPEDIARVEHISQLDLLEGVTTGKKLVVFKSAADAMRLLPHIHEDIDIIGYNLEHGPANPIFEQENPVESIKQLREVTDLYELELALGPDRRFAQSDGAAMAPYADYFILQVQKVQTEPDTVYEFVEPLIEEVRLANPDIQISLQIRTEGDVDQLLDLLSPLQEEIQGVSVLTSEETISVTEEIMETLRPAGQIKEPEPTPDAPENPAVSESAITAEPLTEEESMAETPDLAEKEETQSNEVLPAPTPTEIVTTAEANERSGSTALFIVIAVVAGFAIGAGYVNHRTSS